jgi:hypothetical protein
VLKITSCFFQPTHTRSNKYSTFNNQLKTVNNPMSEDHKKQLNQQLWNITNTHSVKIDADKMGLLQQMFV